MTVNAPAPSHAVHRPSTSSRIDTAIALAMAVGLLALYVRTLAPDVLGGDAGELQFVPRILSLAHPTGYPLHTLLGHAWARLVPWGSVAWRANLLSAVAGAVGVGLLYGAARGYGASRGAALLGSAALGLSEVYWGQAVLADKYALTAALLAGVLWALARWRSTGAHGWLTASAVLYGLGLAQHRSLILMGPPLLALWLWGNRGVWRQGRRAAGLFLALAAPLTLYLWLPIGAARGLPPGTWHPQSLAEWAGYLLDRGYLGEIRPTEGMAAYLATYARWLLGTFGAPGAVMGLIGSAALLRRRTLDGVAMVSATLLLAVLSASYQVPRQYVFYLPSFVLFALLVALGLTAMGASLSLRLPGRLSPAVMALLLVAVAAPLVPGVAPRYRAQRQAHLDGGALDLWRQDLKSGYRARRLAEAGLAAVEPGATVAADWEQATAFWYLQHVEGLRPDVDIVYPIGRWENALQRGEPTYLARIVPDTGDQRLSAAGPLMRIGPAPATPPPSDATPLSIRWEEGLELVGYRLDDGGFRRGYVVTVTLLFRAHAPLRDDYALSLRLYNAAGEQVWAEDRRHPVLGMYPTSRWAPGDTIADYFEVPFPRDVPAGAYRLGIIAYAMPPRAGSATWRWPRGARWPTCPPGRCRPAAERRPRGLGHGCRPLGAPGMLRRDGRPIGGQVAW